MTKLRLLGFIIALASTSAEADDTSARIQMEAIASELLQAVQGERSVVLKTVSPEDSGLPADFLRSLGSNFEAALLVASEFEIDLQNRAATEEIWAEAIEFNQADFEQVFSVSGADVLLLLNARATAAGIEVSVTAYSLESEDAGRIIASSGTEILALDIRNSLGLDVATLNDQVAQVLAEIESISQAGGLIVEPSTYSEYYHNARLLQQRGEVDLAMDAYENALSIGFNFIDPLYDLIDLATARYGVDAARLYFTKIVKDTLSDELSTVGDLITGGDPTDLIQAINDEEVTSPPVLLAWLNGVNRDLERFNTFMVAKAKATAVDILVNAHSTGSFQRYYIDKIRAAADIERVLMSAPSESADQFWNDWETISRTTVRFIRSGPNDQTPIIGDLMIQDAVDLTRPVELCLREFPDGEEVCQLVDTSSNPFTNEGDDWLRVSDSISLRWTQGLFCVTRVRYTDKLGFSVVTPVFINHELRPAYAPDYLELIESCAGEFYRPRN